MPRRADNVGDIAEQVRASIQPQEPRVEPPRLLVPSGSTLLDLALSGHVSGGYSTGTMANLIGDKNSGKTMLALSGLAEAARTQALAAYRLIYDDVECALQMDMSYLFGSSIARFEVLDKPSATARDFRDNLWAAFDDGRPFIYVVDSLDALTTEEELAKTEEEIKARAAGKELKGSYAMDKAKFLSSLLRQIKSKVAETQSVVIVISQTRDNIDPMSFQKKTRAGGQALGFYSAYICWMAYAGKRKNKEYVIGVDTKVRVERSKASGRPRDVAFPIYYDYGVDDIGSMVDWMLMQQGFKGNAAGFTVPQLNNQKYSRKQFIDTIEADPGGLANLQTWVRDEWDAIEQGLRLDRRRRFE